MFQHFNCHWYKDHDVFIKLNEQEGLHTVDHDTSHHFSKHVCTFYTVKSGANWSDEILNDGSCTGAKTATTPRCCNVTE